LSQINQEFVNGILRDKPVAAGLRAVVEEFEAGLKDGTIKAEQAVPSFKNLGIWMGALDPLNLEGSMAELQANVSKFYTTEQLSAEATHARIFTESNPAVRSQSFAVLTGALLASKMIEMYQSGPSIAEKLYTNMPNQTVRNQRLAGLTTIGSELSEVLEGHNYQYTSFGEKYVTTSEAKYGRALGITKELIIFDQTGECYRRAGMMAEFIRDEMERKKIRMIIDADSGTGTYVYRPSGTGEVLYNTNASNLNYVGSGGVTGFNAAVPLVDHTDLDTILQYRASKVVDDRIDGTPRPIGNINSGLTLLVSPAKYATAHNIVFGDQLRTGDGASMSLAFSHRNPVAGFITSVEQSPYIGEVNADDYYIGNFKKQFVWTEIWPLRTAVQGEDSQDAFDRDIVFKIKASVYGGMSALDSRYVTKVDGA
jgi:hypothetical protein